MKRHYAEIVREAEQRISALLETQCRDTASAHHGGWLTPERGYSEPGHSSGAIDSLLSVYLCGVRNSTQTTCCVHSTRMERSICARQIFMTRR